MVHLLGAGLVIDGGALPDRYVLFATFGAPLLRREVVFTPPVQRPFKYDHAHFVPAIIESGHISGSRQGITTVHETSAEPSSGPIKP
jgi:hypothetical protein